MIIRNLLILIVSSSLMSGFLAEGCRTVEERLVDQLLFDVGIDDCIVQSKANTEKAIERVYVGTQKQDILKIVRSWKNDFDREVITDPEIPNWIIYKMSDTENSERTTTLEVIFIFKKDVLSAVDHSFEYSFYKKDSH